MGAGLVGVVVLRWVMSVDGRFPRVVADEPAYLAMARLLAGGERWDLGLASTYGPAYSVLLAPWFALGLSGEDVYRAAVATNVVLGGLTFLAFEALARRLPHVDRPLSAGLAAVAASLPALVATTNLAWSDDLAPLAFAVLLLALARVVDRPEPTPVALLVAVTVGGYAVHGRFLPLAPIVVLVLVVLAAGGRLPARLAALATVATAAGLGLVQLGSEALYDRLYDPMQVTQGLNEADRVTHLWPLALSSTGQLWTVVVTTGGLAGIGFVALVLASRDGWRATAGEEARVARLAFPTGPLVALTLVAMVAMAFLVSVVFMTDRPRGDHLVYGRYNDLFTGPLVLWGGAALATATSRLRTAATTLAVGLVAIGAAVVLWRFRRATLEGAYLVYPVLGVVAIDQEGPPALGSITVVGLAVMAVLTGLALVLPRRPRAVALVLVAGVLCVAGSQRAVDRIDPSRHADPGDATVLADVLPDGARLAWVADDPTNPLSTSFYRDQLYTPDNPSVRVQGAPWDEGEPFVVAGARRPEPFAAGYRLAWVEPGSTLGLWVAPGPRQDALADAGDLLDGDGFGADPQADEGSVRYVEGPTVGGGRVRATVEITRPTGAPWPTAAPGGDPLRRIRLGVTVDGARCGCVLLDGRADVERWVRGDEARVTVAVDLALDAPDDEDLTVTVQLLREGIGRFGPPATAAPG
ncbi:MAG TPA: hypothetical protein VF228_15740 [Iamia sp.]